MPPSRASLLPYMYHVCMRVQIKMNGPQRTACLAKGHTSNWSTSKWTDPLAGLGTTRAPFQTIYIDGQLSGYIPVGITCRTRGKLTDNYQILRLASTFARQSFINFQYGKLIIKCGSLQSYVLSFTQTWQNFTSLGWQDDRYQIKYLDI